MRDEREVGTRSRCMARGVCTRSQSHRDTSAASAITQRCKPVMTSVLEFVSVVGFVAVIAAVVVVVVAVVIAVQVVAYNNVGM